MRLCPLSPKPSRLLPCDPGPEAHRAFRGLLGMERTLSHLRAMGMQAQRHILTKPYTFLGLHPRRHGRLHAYAHRVGHWTSAKVTCFLLPCITVCMHFYS